MNDLPDAAWEASAIHPDDRQRLFEETKSYHAISRRLRGVLNKFGYVVGICGMVSSTAMAVAIVVMLPLKQTVAKFYLVDRATGWIGDAVGVRDAPKLFGPRNAEHFLTIYLQARLGFSVSTDRKNWDIVLAMATAPEWQKYQADRKAEDSPQHLLNMSDDYLEIDHIAFGDPVQSDETWSYPVHYEKVVVRSGAVSKAQLCNAVMDFQWHPEMHMTQPQNQINPGGMQVLPLQEIGCH